VRLTADGRSVTQPLTLRLDPRVRTPAAGLAQLSTLTRELYEGARAAHQAQRDARALAARLPSGSAQRMALDSIAPESAVAAPARGGARARRGASATPDNTLESASSAMLSAAMAMQGADVAPTASEVAAVGRARAQGREAMAKWNTLSTTGLAALNAKRKAAGQPPVVIPE